ncbi:flagellar protein FliT [Lentibacillus salicampi]|uniref:Flagellar protein FliT n=1 Tax=Lentibacillus salicampi TaxID=175306 RepID=A0A4Y9ABL4_9BACI|nr:flagellar protein FliT [Lentibacillus salicampi]TFJ93308.1 flagellar protein FliT [Lentibacillus salicampi]
MNDLRTLLDVTKQLDNLLDEAVHAKNRDAIIEQVNHLIETRGKHLNAIDPPFTEEERKLGESLVVLNEQIQDKLNQLFNDLKLEMKQMKKQKKSNRSYINPYENVKTADGVFMDSKN